MLPVLSAYANTPGPAQVVASLTVSDTTSMANIGGAARGAEFSTTRLGNFLSDDAAPNDRDLDSLMSTGGLGWQRVESEGTGAPNRVLAGPTTPTEEAPAPITVPSFGNIIMNQMQTEQERASNPYPVSGSNATPNGSTAQSMYAASQDVLSRIAA